MSLILDALKKAKELTERKPAPPTPTALASFRFGRPSRSQKFKRIGLYALLGLATASSVGYTANFWMKRLRKPRAVLIQPALPPGSEVSHAQDAANEPAESSKQETANPEPPHVVQSVAPAASPTSKTPFLVAQTPVVAPTPPTRLPSSISPVSPTPVLPAPQQNPPAQTTPITAPPAQIATASSPAINLTPEPSPVVPSVRPTPPSGRGEITPPSRDPFELAVFYQKSGDYLKALDQYNKVLEKDPLNSSVYNNLGLIHYATNNTLEAIKAFRQATYIDPKYDKAHNNLGLALRQGGQDSEAQREFERALQLNPKNAEALTNLAALARKSGNIERAKVQYLQAIQVNPANAEAHYNLAMLYEEQGETGNAIDHFKKFLTLGSSSHPDVVTDVERKIEELSKKKQ